MKPGSITILAAISATIIFTSLSIKKDRENIYHNNAEILKADNSPRPCHEDDRCNCPGGFLIHIDSVADPHGSCILCNHFKAMQFPGGFDAGEKFPVAVTIDWKFDTPGCDSSRISIISIVRR